MAVNHVAQPIFGKIEKTREAVTPVHPRFGHAGTDTVRFESRKPKGSPLYLTPNQTSYLHSIQRMLKPYSDPMYVRGLDDAKQPPMEILDDITHSQQFITSVPVPPVSQTTTLLRDRDFMRELAAALPEDTYRNFSASLPIEDKHARKVLDGLVADGHAKAQVLSAIELTRLTSVGVATFLGVSSGLAAESIAKIGTPEQAAFWLNAMNKGLYTSGFALTEENVGSDPIGIETTYKEQPDGSFVLNGNKKFIGNAAQVLKPDGTVAHGGADFLVVYAVDNPAKPPEQRNFKAFMVPRSAITKGDESVIRPSGGPARKMALNEVNNGDFELNDVHVPKEFALGEPGENIYDKLMGALDETRLMVGCMGLGTALASIDAATDYAAERKQKGNVIERYQNVSFPLKKLMAKTEATRLLIHDAADKVDEAARQRAAGEKPRVFKTETAMSKLYGTELGFEAAHQGIRTLGGRGFMNGPEGLGLPKRADDAVVTRIYEGTNEIQHNLIAVGAMIAQGKDVKQYGPLAGPVLLAKQRKAAALLTRPAMTLANPLTTLEAAYDYSSIHAMLKMKAEMKKPWDASLYEGYDQDSLERQHGFDASLPVQYRLALAAKIYTLRHMAVLSQQEIDRIGDKASAEETVRKAKLEHFIEIAAEEAVSHVRELNGRSLKRMEADYAAGNYLAPGGDH